MIKVLKYSGSALCLGVAILLSSCSDWTQTESLELERPTVEQENPELYAEYLTALRTYKAGPHKHLYATFDNSEKQPFNRSHHLTRLPDSLDVVSLIYDDDLRPWELEEIETIRRKGTKVVYTISFEALEKSYTEEKKAAEEAAAVTPEADEEGGDGEDGEEPTVPLFPEFTEWAADKLAARFAVCDRFGYDGVTLSYNGRSTMNMTPEQLEAYTLRQKFLLDAATAWIESHAGKLFIFHGLPQNLIDKQILQSARYIILPTESATSIDGLEKEVLMALRTDVPTDRFLVAVNTIPTDPADKLTGRFETDAAITESAYWVAASEARYTKAGLAILQVQHDYFSTPLLYRYTRSAASIMNPSPVNN